MHLALSLTWLLLLVKYVDAINDRPIIAILAQDAPPDYKRSYIAASYVKYLEASGARVVPIPSHYSDDKVEEIFNGVNGVLFPGGGIKWSTSGYFKHAKYFVKKAIETKIAGGYFPVWGTCLGFETLNVIIGGSTSVLGSFSASDIIIPLNYTRGVLHSRMFRQMDNKLLKALESENITYNHHSSGVSPETYTKKDELNKFFNILSVNNDLKGKTFVSTIEAYEYPIYGTQWHPEKTNFEYTTNEHIPHSFTSIQATQYMANFFVNEARKSNHAFKDAETERGYLIYNYTPEHTALTSRSLKNFEQCYFFERMSSDRLPRKLLTCWVDKKRPHGAPEFTYGRGIYTSLKKVDVLKCEWYGKALDRVKWRKIINDYS